MQKLAFALACVACASNAELVQTSNKRASAEQASDAVTRLSSLATLLLSSNPAAAAFNPSGPALRQAHLCSPCASIVSRVHSALRCTPPVADDDDDDVGGDVGYFTSPTWQRLQQVLDQLPTFAVANEQGQAVQYSIFKDEASAMFFLDLQEAEDELARFRNEFPELNCKLIPVGLGFAYKLSNQDKAVLIPSRTELDNAEVPRDVLSREQPLPLFACEEMTQESETGAEILPVFLSYGDCAAAVKQVARDGEKLEVVSMELPEVVNSLTLDTSIDEPIPFRFIPSSSSAKFFRQ